MSMTIQEQIAQFVPAMLAAPAEQVEQVEQVEQSEQVAPEAVEVFCGALSTTLSYTDSKDIRRYISVEGAIVKGGKQVRDALWAAAEASAILKAEDGKYHAATDIISAGFPKIAKLAEQYTRRAPWVNKESFTTFVNTVATSYVDPDKKMSEKKVLALRMAKHIRREIFNVRDELTIEG